jgi:biopolymer transport protein ExbD/biopolymer transport protein TolR
MNRRKARKRRMVSELNITNLVDVTFALLIIFMITAPMMTQGVQVDLPESESENVEVNDYIQVSVNKRNEIFIDQQQVSLAEFGKAFRQEFGGRVERPVFISGDKKVPYGLMMKVISEVQNAGAVKLGFLTAPLPKSNS